MKYTVQSGDTLSSIALKYLGSASYSSALWQINKGTLRSKSPSTIYAGEVLEIPDQLIRASDTVPQNNVDDVFLYVRGTLFGGWLGVTITRSLEAVSGSFEVSLTDAWEAGMEPWAIFDGDPVKVMIGNDVVITGYVDSTEVSHDASAHSLTVRGRDKTCDLVDCSLVNRPGEFRGKTPEAIASALCAPFGITVKADVDTGGAVDPFRCQPGETVFEAIERLARSRQLLVSGQADGSVLLTRSGRARLGVSLAEGQNVLSCSVTSDSADRFSKYIVEGQSDGQGTANHTARASSFDTAVSRFRPLIIMAEEKADQAYCLNRAKWEARIRAAKSQVASVTVQGWRISDGGALWSVGKLVNLDYPTCRIFAEDLLITDVTLTKSDQGTLAELTLKRPDIYLAESELKETKEILQAHKAATKAQKKAAKSKK